jgi:acetyl-CoA carboxylase biotin carboxyl carrier protein
LKFEDIGRLAELVKTAGLSEIEVEEDGFRLRISNGEVVPPRRDVSKVPTQPIYAHDYIIPEQVCAASNSLQQANGEDSFHFIKSPMVGTFYSAPSPESPNYVEHGSPVKASTVVCIVEAMKVINEIQADVDGVIVEILVKNGQAVEYGQSLFKVKKT